MESNCLMCDTPIPYGRKYCSDLCKERYRYKNTIKEKKCIICNKPFKGTIGTKCCSESCKLKAQRKYKKVCPVCNKSFVARGNGIYCSDVCYRTANSPSKGLIVAECEVCSSKFKTSKEHPEVVCSDTCSTKLFSTYVKKANFEVFGTINELIIKKMVAERNIPTWQEKQQRILR